MCILIADALMQEQGAEPRFPLCQVSAKGSTSVSNSQCPESISSTENVEIPSFSPHNFSRNCGESGHEGAAGSWVLKALGAWMGSTSFSISLVFSHCSAAEMDLLPGLPMGFAMVTAFYAQGWVGHGWQHTDLSLTLWE